LNVLTTMVERVLVVAIGLVVGYLVYKYMTSNRPKDDYSDILSNEKYKIKGQWNK